VVRYLQFRAGAPANRMESRTQRSGLTFGAERLNLSDGERSHPRF